MCYGIHFTWNILKFCSAAGSKALQLLLSKVLKMPFQLSSAVETAVAAADAAELCSAAHFSHHFRAVGSSYTSANVLL